MFKFNARVGTLRTSSGYLNAYQSRPSDHVMSDARRRWIHGPLLPMDEPRRPSLLSRLLGLGR